MVRSEGGNSLVGVVGLDEPGLRVAGSSEWTLGGRDWRAWIRS